MMCIILMTMTVMTATAEPPKVSVGLSGRILGLVLPGTELEVKPNTDRRTPLIVRILQAWPHGTAFRYDIEFYGLEPGQFDIREYLQRKDGSAVKDLPAIPVTIKSVLPPGQIKPNPLEAKNTPGLGGYRTWLIAAGVVWTIVLLVILFAGRGGKKGADLAVHKPRTLADHLRPLVESAMSGRSSPTQLAELERSLLVYWERRLHLQHQKPAETIKQLRHHPEAGPLLEQLEIWLHRPANCKPVDVALLLKPYRNIPVDALAVGTKPS